MTDPQIQILQQLLSGWMNLAKHNQSASTGIYQWNEGEGITTKSTSISSPLPSNEKKRSSTTNTDHHHAHSNGDMAIQNSQDLQLLEKCWSWRQLYQVLEQRKRLIQVTQGQRMREIRNQVRRS